MAFPDFFDNFPSITVKDPLCAFLGAGDGVLTYGYSDAVKLAGHSCPTVAGTWVMLTQCLGFLWPQDMPQRGAMEIFFPQVAEQGVTGVMASVASLVTGARADDGFKGIGGQFRRCGLMHFSYPLVGDLAVRRSDTGAGVMASLSLDTLPRDPRLPILLETWRIGSAAPEDVALFGQLWQERVRQMSLRPDELVRLSPWSAEEA